MMDAVEPQASRFSPTRVGRARSSADEIPLPPAWGKLFALFYITVAVGRLQEAIPALAPLRIGLVTGVVALGLWLLGPGALVDKVAWGAKPTQYVVMILALAVLTVPVAAWPGGSLDYLVTIYVKTVLVFFLIIYYFRSLLDVRRLLWVVTATAALMVVSGVITGSVHDRYHYGRAGTYDANDLALVLVVTFPLAMYVFSSARLLGKAVQAFIMLTCLYGVVLTQSRGGFLAFVVVATLILVRSTLSRSHKVLIAVGAIVVFGILAGPTYWERIRTIWEPQTEYDRTAGGRTEVWKTGLMLMATRPWGVGINGFEVAEGLSHGGRGKWSASHNSFLQIGVDLGVLGLAAFLLLLHRSIQGLRRVQQGAQRQTSPPVPLLAARRGPLTLGQGARLPRAPAPMLHHETVLLASALEMSLWGFIVGGFFLSQAYGGMLYVLLGTSLVCARLAEVQGLVPNHAGCLTAWRPAGRVHPAARSRR